MVPALAKLPAGLAGGIGLTRGEADRTEGAPDGWSAFSTKDADQARGDPDGWSGKWSVLIILNLKKENISNHGLCSNVLSYYLTKFCFTRRPVASGGAGGAFGRSIHPLLDQGGHIIPTHYY